MLGSWVPEEPWEAPSREAVGVPAGKSGAVLQKEGMGWLFLQRSTVKSPVEDSSMEKEAGF